MNANEVAEKVEKVPNYRDNPLSKTQVTILKALGIDLRRVAGHAHAKKIFEALGIVVVAKRQGRSYVPEVTVLPREGYVDDGGWNPGGDGWEHTTKIEYPDIDFSAIADYVVSK